MFRRVTLHNIFFSHWINNFLQESGGSICIIFFFEKCVRPNRYFYFKFSTGRMPIMPWSTKGIMYTKKNVVMLSLSLSLPKAKSSDNRTPQGKAFIIFNPFSELPGLFTCFCQDFHPLYGTFLLSKLCLVIAKNIVSIFSKSKALH